MAYVASLVFCVDEAHPGLPREWTMFTDSALTSADADNFISDGYTKGLKAGDRVWVYVCTVTTSLEAARASITAIGLHMVTADPTSADETLDLSNNLLGSYSDSD